MNTKPKRAAPAKPKTRASKPQTRKHASAKTGTRKKLKQVRDMHEAIKAKEVVQLPNGWKVTPPSVNGYGFPTIDIGHPIDREIYR